MTRDLTELERVRALAAAIRARLGDASEWLVVLGSGLGGALDTASIRATAAFSTLPHLPAPGVVGHGGHLSCALVDGVRMWFASGRVHAYEGHTAQTVVRLIRACALCGVKRLLLTNAAGGLHPELKPGTLLCIDDHINLSGLNPFEGSHEPAFGPRFPDASQVYNRQLTQSLFDALDGAPRARGVYASVRGPSYETPAEVRMLAHLGASAVGMSTALEALAAHAMGVQVAGMSCITNFGAGLSAQALDHAEVLAVGETARIHFRDRILPRLSQLDVAARA